MSVTALQYINNDNSKDTFVGLFHYLRPLRSKHDSKLEIYGLLSVKSDTDIPGHQIAKFAWDGIVDGFEYSNADSNNESLKTALKESTRRIKQLITNDVNLADHGIDVNFSVFVFSCNGVYVGLVGENDIYLYKKGRIISITEMLVKKRAQTAALVLEDADLLFSSTSGLITQNMKNLMGYPDKEKLTQAIVDIGKIVLNGEGLIYFGKEEETKKSVKKVFEPKMPQVKEVVKKKNVVKEEILEPKDTDYIPTTRKVTPILQQNKNDKDLKYFLSILQSRISFLGIFLKKIFGYLGNIFSKVFTFVSTNIKKMFGNLGFNLKEKLGRKRWFKQVSAKVSQSNVGKRKIVDMKGFKIDGYKEKNTRIKRFKVVFMVIAVLGLLIFGVKFTLDQKEAREIHNQAQGILDTVQDYINKADSKVRTDKDGAEMYIFKAQEELAKLPEGMNDKDSQFASDLDSKVLGLQDDMYRRVALSQQDGSLDKYIDTIISFSNNSKPTDIAIYMDDSGSEYLLVTDSNLKSVYRVSLYNKEVKRLPDNEGLLKSPSKIYVGKTGIYVLDSEVGIVKAKYDGDWFGTFEKLTGLSISSIGAKDIAEFAILTSTDNAYILDRDKKVLLKSTNVGSGYGLSYSYISNEAFSTANDILADLSVYILTSGSSGLNRYIYSYIEQKQVPAPVEVVGLNGEFKNLKSGYTRDNLQYGLYLYDSEDKRLMKFEKPIEGGGEVLHPNQVVLLKQYLCRECSSDILSNTNDFVVDSKEEYSYILDGTTVWKVRL